MTRLLAGAALGVGVMTGFPPYEWTTVSWLSLIGLIALLATAPSGRSARWTAYLFGLGFFGTLLWWLSAVELIAFYPMVMLQAVPMIIVGTAVFRFRDDSAWVFVLAAGGSMALAEFIRVRFPYGGFPWGSLGLSVGSTPLRPSVQWIGSSGWTVILVALAALAYLAIRRRTTLIVVAGAFAVVLAVALAANLWPAVPTGEARTVAIVQGNSPCPGTRCAGERTIIYENHLALTRTIESGSVDLVVWPESSTGARTDPVQNPEIGGAIGAEAERIGAVMTVGGDRDAGPEAFINANVVFGTTGEILGEYRKRHPVPFGEYVPLRPLLDWIPALDRVPRDMVQGTTSELVDVGGVRFGTVISYEGAFARYEREAVVDGAEFIVVATNEASFGDTPASDQFIAISRVRAAELGVDIVHAAVTGKSAFVRADGAIDGLTGLFTAGVVVDNIAARDAGLTLYARLGDWVEVLAMLSYLVLLVRTRLGTAEAHGTSDS